MKTPTSGDDAAAAPERFLGTARGNLTRLMEEELAFGRAFLLAPVAIAAGAIWWFSRAEAPAFWALMLYGTLFIIAAVLLRHARALIRLTTAACALFFAGALFAALQTDRLSTVMLDSPVVTHVTGIVAEREKTTSGWRYVVDVSATDDPVIHRPPQRVALVARGNKPPVAVGGGISGLARLSPPSAPALPGLVDFGFLSYFDGIGAIGYFYGPPEPAAMAANAPKPGAVMLAIAELREAIAARIRAVLPGESGAFANAIITGERRAMGAETLDALRNAGLAHVIAISGLHMALAAGIFFTSLRLLLALSVHGAEAFATKKVAAIAALAAAFFYLLVSGMQVSAQRAFLMLAIMLIAALFDRPAISLRNVAVSALVILALSPSEASGPGMQMSFAATAALIAGYSLWQRSGSRRHAESRRNGVIRILFLFAAGIVLTALIGGLSTAPFAIAHFQRVAGYGLLGNLLAMPVITFIVMPAGLAAMLTMPLGLHGPFLHVMGAGLDWVMATAHWVKQLGGAFSTGKAPAGFLLLFTAGFVPFVLLRTRLRYVGVVPMLLAFGLFARAGDHSAVRILVSEDGDLVAIVRNTSAAVSDKRPPAFIYEQWQTALALEETVPPIMVEPGEPFIDATDRRARLDDNAAWRRGRAELAGLVSEALLTPDRFYCKKDLWCVAAPDGLVVVQALHPALVGLACDVGDIVISLYRTGYQTCRSGRFLVTPQMRREAGAIVFTLAPAFGLSEKAEVHDGITTVRPLSGEGARKHACTVVTIAPSVTTLAREWSRHRLYDWRSGDFRSPIALPERLVISGSDESGRPACPEP
ncbi:ComEC/Rec2 family competence protein [Martelella endophytica]|uniref:ComEC/Rec2 family competence protein n=1 Tax=Martelella endophytica TaxID=1486262 RepID=UPI00069702B4|nr:ComEC/Rec2 family competence protein [Martelella endophytica]